MNSEMVALIEKLANQLGTSAEYLWGVMIGQVNAYLVGIGIQYAVCFAVIYFGIRWIKKTMQNMDELRRSDMDFPAIMGMFGVGIVMAIAGISAFCEIERLVTAIMNPEGWALQEILRHVKK